MFNANTTDCVIIDPDHMTVGNVVIFPGYREAVESPLPEPKADADGYRSGWDDAAHYFTDEKVLYVLRDEYDYDIHLYGATFYADLEDLKRDHPDYQERGVLRVVTRRVDRVRF